MIGTISSDRDVQKLHPENLGTWILMTFVGHSIGAAIFMALAAFFQGIPIHKLWVPYAALACCGVIFGPLLYWARLARGRPKLCAIRFTVAMFLCSQSVMLALGFDMSKLGMLAFGKFINDYAPFLVLFFALCSVPGYFIARHKLTNPR